MIKHYSLAFPTTLSLFPLSSLADLLYNFPCERQQRPDRCLAANILITAWLYCTRLDRNTLY